MRRTKITVFCKAFRAEQPISNLAWCIIFTPSGAMVAWRLNMIHGAKGLRALRVDCFLYLVRWRPFGSVSLCGELNCHPLMAANVEPGWGLKLKSMWWPVLHGSVPDFYVRCESIWGHTSSSQISHLCWHGRGSPITLTGLNMCVCQHLHLGEKIPHKKRKFSNKWCRNNI